MMHDILKLPSPEVAEVVARSGIAVIPFGSTEQHGPHLPCGTDTMAAELIAAEIAQRLDGLYVPSGPFGVTPIHAGHPGTISLSRSTFESLVADICHELIGQGFVRFVFVNWHEGNIASLNAVATDIQSRHDATFIVANACYVAQRVYAEEGGELTHGGGIETAAVLAYDERLADVARAGAPSRPPRAQALDEMRRSREVYGFITDVTEIDQAGWYGDPHWATPERAAHFVTTVSDAVMEQLAAIFELGQR
jgi:creatinine amidohydrolase